VNDECNGREGVRETKSEVFLLVDGMRITIND
jgi:hypothetical protein